MKVKRQVFFNCDFRGILPISVAIDSLLRAAKSDSPLVIHLIHDTKFAELGGCDRVREIVARYPFASVKMVDFSATLAQHPELNDARWPPMTWSWCFCTEIFPELTGNLVFIDWDMYVRHDLAELYELPLEEKGYISAAVSESLREHRAELIAAGWPEAAGYSVNTGLQVINTDAFRRENICTKMLDWYKAHKTIAECVEQDAANVIYGERILRLHLKYNFTVGWFDRILNANPFRRLWRVYPPRMVLEAVADPAILHFIGHRKPWWWNHRAYRNVYRKAMEELGLFGNATYKETFSRKIVGRIFDAYNAFIAFYARLLLATVVRKRVSAFTDPT